jgi:protein O-mannosyl-transferase
LALVVLGVFGVAWNFPYSGYDDFLVLRDSSTARWHGMGALFGLWFSKIPNELFYIPWSYTALALEHGMAQLLELSYPVVIHSVNVLLHTVNCLVVFLIFKKFGAPAFACFVGSAVYGVHPLQVEAVGWTLGQRDLWSAFFAWSSVLVFPFNEKNKRAEWVSQGLFVLSLLSKPTSIPVPFAMVGLAWGLSLPLRRYWYYARATLCLAVPIAIVTLGMRAAQSSQMAQSVGDRVALTGYTMLLYVWKLVLPFGLVPHYANWGAESVLASPALWKFAVGGWMLFIGLLILLKGQKVYQGALACVFLLASPSLGLQPFSFQIHSIIADRFLYLAMFGVAALFTFFIAERQKQLTAKVLAIGVCGLCAVLSATQIRLWASPGTLWSANLKAYPHSRLARANLAKYFEEQGNYESATKVLLPYVEAFPKDDALRVNLASMYGEQRQLDKAKEHLEVVLKRNPSNTMARRNLGNVYYLSQDWVAAILEYEQVLEQEPGNLATLKDLGDCYLALGKKELARPFLERYLQFVPGDAETRGKL